MRGDGSTHRHPSCGWGRQGAGFCSHHGIGEVADAALIGDAGAPSRFGDSFSAREGYPNRNSIGVVADGDPRGTPSIKTGGFGYWALIEQWEGDKTAEGAPLCSRKLWGGLRKPVNGGEEGV